MRVMKNETDSTVMPLCQTKACYGLQASFGPSAVPVGPGGWVGQGGGSVAGGRGGSPPQQSQFILIFPLGKLITHPCSMQICDIDIFEIISGQPADKKRVTKFSLQNRLSN